MVTENPKGRTFKFQAPYNELTLYILSCRFLGDRCSITLSIYSDKSGPGSSVSLVPSDELLKGSL